MTDHTFKGLLAGERVLLGVLDGAPRLAVARPGFALVTDPGDGSPLRLHPDVLADAGKMAFDSDWLEAQRVLVSGAATASGTADSDGFWPLVTFPEQPSVPIVWVYSRSAPAGLSYTMGGVTPQNTIPVKVTTTEIRVRNGNGYNGFSMPTDVMTYVVFANGIVA